MSDRPAANSFLERIAASTRRRVARVAAVKPLEALQEEATALAAIAAQDAHAQSATGQGTPAQGAPGQNAHAQSTPRQGTPVQDAHSQSASGHFAFERALAAPGVSFICELKKASPSKGLIAPDFPYLDIARQYVAAGAAAISVLTEPDFFQGDDRYLQEVAAEVDVPVLRKDFVIDPYQIYEAVLLGASAVLLIVALLDEAQLCSYVNCAHELGLSVLVEVHNTQELTRALAAGARIIGVNNRDLKTFEVDLGVSERLAPLIPQGVRFVAESGIRTRADVQFLEDLGADALLIGETLMRAPDKVACLAALRGGT